MKNLRDGVFCGGLGRAEVGAGVSKDVHALLDRDLGLRGARYGLESVAQHTVRNMPVTSARIELSMTTSTPAEAASSAMTAIASWETASVDPRTEPCSGRNTEDAWTRTAIERNAQRNARSAVAGRLPVHRDGWVPRGVAQVSSFLNIGARAQTLLISRTV